MKLLNLHKKYNAASRYYFKLNQNSNFEIKHKTSPCYQVLKKILEKLIYKRLYTFLSKNIIYNVQFGFRQQYSTSHGLINITEGIRKALDDENIGCGVLYTCKKLFIQLITRYC